MEPVFGEDAGTATVYDLARFVADDRVDTSLIGAVRDLVARQVDAAFGADGFARVIESLRATAGP